jgi:hypothetical protein
MFSQEPSRRAAPGEERAVLNVVRSPRHWINGVLISAISHGFFFNLDSREKGYTRVRVDPSSLGSYGAHSRTSVPDDIYIYTGNQNKQNSSILPNTAYLHICLEGANQWGADFYNDFLDSTFVKKNILLRTYLASSNLK